MTLRIAINCIKFSHAQVIRGLKIMLSKCRVRISLPHVRLICATGNTTWVWSLFDFRIDLGDMPKSRSSVGVGLANRTISQFGLLKYLISPSKQLVKEIPVSHLIDLVFLKELVSLDSC